MEYLNNTILCLTYEEFVPAIAKADTYNKLRQREKIAVHGLGGNGRRVLIEYESMPDRYKLKIREHYGDPYQYASKQPIINALEWDLRAQDYYNNYVLPTGDKLPNSDTDLKGKAQINYVKRYTENATWLNMITRMTTDKRTLKKELNISMADFWVAVCELIKARKVSLPATRLRLTQKLREYQVDGFDCLIDVSKFGNGRSKKVADEVAEALLEKMMAHHNRHDNVIIADAYNAWAKENNRPEIKPATVGYRRKHLKGTLMLERDGLAMTTTTLSKHIKRKRPSSPLLFINSDDNVFDVFFKADDNQYYRPVVYVVLDTFNDYVLGYAWGDKVTIDLVKEAYRNAHNHVRELTGDAYCWQQIQTDRWGVSGKNSTELDKFFNSQAIFTPATARNAQAKYIERFFGSPWHKVLKALFPNNYSGHNISAKTQFNRDNLKPANFPHVSQAAQMIEGFIQVMRQTTRGGSEQTRQQEWLEAFRASDKSKKKLLSTADRLEIFGKAHKHTNKLTAGGLTPTILGETRTYELDQAQIDTHIGKDVRVYYDEYDLSEVLVTDGKGLRFTAKEYGLVPSAIADYEEGDAARIRQLMNEKRTLMPRIQARIESRDKVLDRAKIDAESRLKAGVLVKEISHQDQRLVGASMNGTTGAIIQDAETIRPAMSAENTPEEGGVCAENGGKKTVKKPLKPFKQSANAGFGRF